MPYSYYPLVKPSLVSCFTWVILPSTSTVYFSGVTGEAEIQYPTLQTITVTADINDNNAESAPITLYHGTYKFKLMVLPYYPDSATRPTGKRGDVILTECP